MHADNKKKKKDIQVFDGWPTNGLDRTAITAEAKYTVNITSSQKDCLNLHYNLYANGVKI